MRSAKGPATLATLETRSVAKGAPQHPCGQSANQPRRGQTDRHLMDRLIVKGTRTETDGDVERRCDRVTERGLVERERERGEVRQKVTLFLSLQHSSWPQHSVVSEQVSRTDCSFLSIIRGQ